MLFFDELALMMRMMEPMEPIVKRKQNQPQGRAIWYAHQGPMRIRTSPKLTKAEKKAARKARRSLREVGDA